MKNQKIAMLLPNIVSMMTGVYTIHVSYDGIANLIYTDGSNESAKLSDDLMKQVLAWMKYQSGKCNLEAEVNTMQIVSEVQAQRALKQEVRAL